VKVADKANEIVAIPKLLDVLAIEGAVVTIVLRLVDRT
jgi:predicted transposase YbfD/YdcC